MKESKSLIKNISTDESELKKKYKKSRDISEIETQVLSFNGLHLLNYNEFLTDVVEDGVPYRVFYNPILNSFLANEIVSFDYDGKRTTLLKNPANTTVSKKMEEIFFAENLPEKDWLDTVNHFQKRIKVIKARIEKDRKSKKNPVGNKPKAVYKTALLWCVKNHPKNLKSKRPTLVRAYMKFGKWNHEQDSFIKTLASKWSVLLKEYGNESKEFKVENSLETYAKSKCRIARNDSK